VERVLSGYREVRHAAGAELSGRRRSDGGLFDHLETELATAPPGDKEVLQACMTAEPRRRIADVAAALKISEAAAEGRIRRATLRIRKRLQNGE
jgi:DNA-directed RNA polymerase specialized sigma24 family protein